MEPLRRTVMDPKVGWAELTKVTMHGQSAAALMAVRVSGVASMVTGRRRCAGKPRGGNSSDRTAEGGESDCGKYRKGGDGCMVESAALTAGRIVWPKGRLGGDEGVSTGGQ